MRQDDVHFVGLCQPGCTIYRVCPVPARPYDLRAGTRNMRSPARWRRRHDDSTCEGPKLYRKKVRSGPDPFLAEPQPVESSVRVRSPCRFHVDQARQGCAVAGPAGAKIGRGHWPSRLPCQPPLPTLLTRPLSPPDPFVPTLPFCLFKPALLSYRRCALTFTFSISSSAALRRPITGMGCAALYGRRRVDTLRAAACAAGRVRGG